MKKNLAARAISTLGVLACSVALTGCASIVSGTNQIISVQTTAPNGDVAGATCKLQNDKGVYYVTTPGTVTVRRAFGDMSVLCEKAGFSPAMASFKSSTKAMLAGNILFGGIIGVGVDAASGAAYDYPNLLQVMMGGNNDAGYTPAPSVASGTGTASTPY